MYSHTTRATGTVLTATIYNGDNINHITNQNPLMTGAYSDNVGQMQTVTDPGEVGTESLAGSLGGELERLRFAIKDIKTALGYTINQWYETAVAGTAFLFPGTVRATTASFSTQIFSSGSGTYTKPAGCVRIKVRLCGGGGGGGGVSTNGGNGGDTTFGPGPWKAGGGVKGLGSGARGGLGGVVSGAPDIGSSGGDGGPGYTSAAGTAMGGCGGASAFGGGGSGGQDTVNNGLAGLAIGSGGGGIGATSGGATGAGGGAGAYAEIFINAPSATYAYAVGAAGTAGTGAGVGVAGIVIVEEFYI